MSSDKNIPPINHIVEPCKLRVGDHIYRRLYGIKALVGYHHGVVTEIDNGIKVIQMTRKKGICVCSLANFLGGYKCRLVYYNVPKMYEAFHANGTCHVEKASPISAIKKRIEWIMESSKHKTDVYALLGANCEEFAVWIMTGLYKGMQMSQLKGAEHAISHFRQSSGQLLAATSSAIARVSKYADDLALVASNASGAKSVAADAIENGATQTTLSAAKYSATTIGAGIGIAAAIELVCSAYKVYKYKSDYKYLQCDLWRDLGRSWIVTGICTAIGVALIPIGWYAILPSAGMGFLMSWLMRKFDVFDKKSHKEKVYKEYGLSVNSTKKELKAVRRQIRREIRNEKLHPNSWPSDLESNKKPKRLEKFLWLKAIMDLLEKDIVRGYVTFDDDEQKKSQEAIQYIELPKTSKRRKAYYDTMTNKLLDDDHKQQNISVELNEQKEVVWWDKIENDNAPSKQKSVKKKQNKKFAEPGAWEYVIETMASTIHPKDQLHTFRKMKKIVENVKTNDKRYRTLYLNNQNLKETVLAFDGGLEFLYNLGFEHENNSQNKLICCKVNNYVVEACLICLEDKIETLQSKETNAFIFDDFLNVG